MKEDKVKPAGWKIFLAMALSFGSVTLSYWAGSSLKDDTAGFFYALAALSLSMLAISLGQDDGSDRKIVDPKRIAEIRAECRKECCEELQYLFIGGSGVREIGVDVARVYATLMRGNNVV